MFDSGRPGSPIRRPPGLGAEEQLHVVRVVGGMESLRVDDMREAVRAVWNHQGAVVDCVAAAVMPGRRDERDARRASGGQDRVLTSS